MNHLVVVLISALGFLAQVNAECANACNGHGKCTSYDMCICHRNWQANDCSERVCMHGLAHVDTPKGDLDGSGLVIAPDTGVVVDNSFQYPYGTTEQFPQMEDSDLEELTNSAHYYMECSNKGICDRSSGLCECFDGYDGVACQRASCPGYPASCSGHGVCKSAKQLAEADGGNVYKLWNKDATMGCECDAGYFGPDCSQRSCKVGVDPLYLDDTSTIKYSIFDFAVLTTDVTGTMTHGAGSLFDDGTPLQRSGHWAIKFYDHSGEDWITEPIVAGASCSAVIAALEALPNDVIPAGETECYQTTKTNVADSLFVNDRTNDDTSKKDYKITYRMSIWDAYVYKKFGSNFQDVLSVKTKLGNQVYSPLLWLPGSMTQPFDAADHENLLSNPITNNVNAGLKVVNYDSAGPTTDWGTGFVAIDPQAEGAGVFELGDTTSAQGVPNSGDNELSATEVALFVADAVVIVSGTQCNAAGYYTIKTSLTSATAAELAVKEAIPAQNAADNCYLTLATIGDLGTGTQMKPTALSGELAVTSFSGTGINRATAVSSGLSMDSGDSTAKITLTTPIATTADDYHKIVANQQIVVSGSTCTNVGMYTVRSFDGTDIGVWEAFTAVGGAGACTVNIYSDNLPSTATRLPLSGDIYRIKFFGNPGKLQQPEIVTHLDGKRNSLMSTEYATSKVDESSGEPFTTDLVITKVFTDGQQGEDKDYFADHCDGVTVTVNHDNIVADPSVTISTGYTAEQRYADGNVAKEGKWTLLADATETALLKKCLGDSDMTATNNQEIHNWDYGSADFPHLIKLVRTVTSITDGGYYVAIYWDTTTSEFVMLNPFTPPDALETDVYEVYTTRGTLARVSSKAQAYFGFGQKTVITTNTQRMGAESGWDGDVSCEIGNNAVHASRLSFSGESDGDSMDDEGKMFINDIDTTVGGLTGNALTYTYVKACVNKTDMVTFLNWDYPALNSPKINLYTVDRLVKDKVTRTKKLRYGSGLSTAAGSGNGAVTGGDGFQTTDNQQFSNPYGDMHFGTNVMTLDLSTNWAVELNSDHATTTNSDSTAWASPYYIYKFIPAADSTYEYVAECANRGLCDHETGTCECFTGYTNDACDQQDSLSL